MNIRKTFQTNSNEAGETWILFRFDLKFDSSMELE